MLKEQDVKSFGKHLAIEQNKKSLETLLIEAKAGSQAQRR